MKRSIGILISVGATLLATAVVYNQAAYRKISIETFEVTASQIALSPDGETLIFCGLGHLHLLPAAGGKAAQATFGPAYDSDPTFSPDGRHVAFVSNLDGSSSNIFVLDLETRHVTQVTREGEANRPAWSPDGRTIAYTRNIPRIEHPLELAPGFGDTGLRDLRTVPATGGVPRVVVPTPQFIDTVFYLPDGRLAWSVRDGGGGGMRTGPQVKETQVESETPDGQRQLLLTIGADIGRAVPGPKGDRLYYVNAGAVRWITFGENAVPQTGPRVTDSTARLAVVRDDDAIYAADGGGLWRAALPSGNFQRIPFRATMTTEVRRKIEPKWQAPPATAEPVALRAVLAPKLSPDGADLVVMAGGFLWEQSLRRPEAARLLFEDGAFSRDPVYSPDGRKLAYVASERGRRELRVYDFESKRSRAIFATDGAEWPLYPSWSPDGKQIVFQHARNLGAPFPIVAINLDDGSARELTRSMGSWVARPHFAHDGRTVYFTSRTEKIGALYRISVEHDAQPERLTDLTRHVHEGLVSPDGQWMAQRRNSEIWIAPMTHLPIRDDMLRRLSSEGGRGFSFTPDSESVIYCAGGKVFRQPVAGGARTEMPLHIRMQRAVAPPLLITRVHPLDFDEGRFPDEASIFVEGGRIRWIGSDKGRRLPANVTRLDGGGRFAIPGLFDAHVHSAWANQQANEDAFIAFGVTSVRDVGGRLDLLTALEDRADITALPAPRYFYSGEIFEGLMPFWGDAFSLVGSKQEAIAELGRLKALGVDFVKIYPSVPWDLQQAISEEASRMRLPVVGHGIRPEEILRRVLWGTASLEHSTSVTGVYEDIHKLLAATGSVADLTLSVGGGALMRAQQPDWESNWRVREFVPESARRQGPAIPAGTARAVRDEMLAAAGPRFARVRSAREMGVVMAVGTDSLMNGVYFGLSLHWEIAQFADAGIPNIEVLRMATLGGAKLVGADGDLGSLTPGKLADIVLLEKSPIENIRHTQSIWRVIKAGHVYDPLTLRLRPTEADSRQSVPDRKPAKD